MISTTFDEETGEVTTEDVEEGELDLYQLEKPLPPISHFKSQNYFELAHKYPRDSRTFIERLFNIVTCDINLAEACYYPRSRRNKETKQYDITYEETVRLCELAVCAWQNIQIFMDDPKIDLISKTVAVRVYGIDYESNNQISSSNVRTLTPEEVAFLTNYESLSNEERNKGIATKINAATSSAYGSCVKRLIPRIFLKVVIDKTRTYVAHERTHNQTLNQRLQTCILYLQNHGVSVGAVLNFAKKRNSAELNREDLIKLNAACKSIKEGRETCKQVFGEGLERLLEKALPIEDLQGQHPAIIPERH